MGTYKAKKNSQELDDEPKSYEDQKRESTEKAVDLAGEVALDYFTGGQGSKIKNMAENVPIVGNTVKNTWDGAVKKVSKTVSKTPAGDMLKKADDAGVTDMARTAKDAMSMKGGGGSLPSNNNGTESLKNTSNKSKGLSNLNAGTNSKVNNNQKMFGDFKFELPLVLKIKIIITLSCIFLLFMMVVAVFANDDIKNLSLTNQSSMTAKNGTRDCSLEEVENRLLYVGDSRIVGMKSVLENNNIDYIAEVGKGYDWYKNVALATIEEKLQNNSNLIVVLSLGVNDLNNIDNYISAYKDLISKYSNNSIYIMSVTPVDESKAGASGYSVTNTAIEAFNKKLSENFSSNYIDIYSNLTNIGTTDGLHYDNDTYKRINSLVSSSISNSGREKCGSASGDVIGKLEEVANWYIQNVKTYQITPCGGKGSGKRKFYDNPFLSRKIGDDCTEFANVYMSYVCGTELAISASGEMVNSKGNWAKPAEACGWKAYTTDEIGELQTGDVLIADNSVSYSYGAHAEVYVDASHTFGWGKCQSQYPLNNTISKETRGGHTVLSDSYGKNSHKYVTVYRYMNSTDGGNSNTASINLNAKKMNNASFNHGAKTKENQKYIMLHDTEVDASPENIVNSWANSKNGVAAHFVVGRDGSIVQAVELDVITHHAGFGGPGNYDSKFGVGNNDKKGNGDDLVGQNSGQWNGYTSYGMNSYSIGIEMVHVGGQDYPEVQLNAVDKVIAYIDSYYGKKSTIIDHKDWRPSNSDTDSKFATYLSNYKSSRHH